MLEFGRPLIWGENTGDTAQTFALPAGTVTFLLSDIEGSTRLWEAEPDAMARAVPRLYRIFDEAVSAYDGVRPVEQGEGDSVVAAFSRASDALAAALAAQRAIHVEAWPSSIELRVLIALHVAEAQLRAEGNYFGVALSRGVRLRAIASGGQTVMSGGVRDLVADRLPAGGLTNPEIAERMFISRGTVKTHLEHVYAKLGLANRAALATAYASRKEMSM